MKKIGSGVLIACTLFFASCAPKDAEINKNVAENVQPVASGISTDVKDGVATLSGQVKDEATRTAAEDAAKKATGVKSVVNNITVVVPEPVVTLSPDDALQKGLNDIMKDYPGATAVVTNGEILVTGTLSAEKWKRLKMSLDALNPKKVDAVTLKIINP
ncbi:MAG: BON domain-containing protein [Bacteroidota bacterium]